MIQYIYDFLSIFFDKLKDKEKVKAIILFGSFARGNQRKDSDIDIFIDVTDDNKKKVQQVTNESLNEFELKATKTWKLKGIKNHLVPIVDSIDLDKWSELKREIASYGILLYGLYKTNVTKDKQSILIEYDISKLKQKDKMKILRKLYGYNLIKGKKVYTQEGLISKSKAEKLNNSLIISLENYKPLVVLLKEHKIPIRLRNVWVE